MGPHDEPADRQCLHFVGTGANARQCLHDATRDGYCTKHARHPERIRESAMASLHTHVDNAIDALGRIVADPDGGDADFARHNSNQIKAAIAILDRTGHGPASSVSIEDGRAQLEALLAARRDDDDGD